MTLENGSGEAGEPTDAGSGGNGGAPTGTESGTDSTLLNGQSSAGTGSTANVQQENTLLDQISDKDIKNDPSLQQVNSLEDLAKSYVHAQKLVGKDKIALPSSPDDHEAWNDVLSKLGRPESPDKYELPQPAEDSRVQVRDEMQDAFKQKVHELGLTDKQAKDLWGWYIGEVAEGEVAKLDEKMEQQRAEAEKALRQEFGNQFDAKLQDAYRAATEYGGDELVEKLEQSGLGNDPTVLKFLAQVGSTLREDTVGGSSPQMGFTPDQAKQELTRLKSDKEFMQTYLDNTATGHDAAVERMKKLYADAYPDQG